MTRDTDINEARSILGEALSLPYDAPAERLRAAIEAADDALRAATGPAPDVPFLFVTFHDEAPTMEQARITDRHGNTRATFIPASGGSPAASFVAIWLQGLRRRGEEATP